MSRNKVFISYRTSDTPFLSYLFKKNLEEKQGVSDLFLDTENIREGGDIPQSILNALHNSKVVLLLINQSFQFNNSGNDWVRAELKEAMDRNIPVYPVFFNREDFPELTPNDLSFYVGSKLSFHFGKNDWDAKMKVIGDTLKKMPARSENSLLYEELKSKYEELINNDSRIHLKSDKLVIAHSRLFTVLSCIGGLIGIGLLLGMFSYCSNTSFLFGDKLKWGTLGSYEGLINASIPFALILSILLIKKMFSAFRNRIEFSFSDKEVAFLPGGRDKHKVAFIDNYDAYYSWFFRDSRVVFFKFKDESKRFRIIKGKSMKQKNKIIKMIKFLAARLAYVEPELQPQPDNTNNDDESATSNRRATSQ